MTYETNSSGDHLAVFSEIYYDEGWNAYVDGKKVDYVRADYVLRAMKIPAGKHQVEWKFEPEVVATGNGQSGRFNFIDSVFSWCYVYKEIQSAKAE
ncbi:MAG: YfhO family protein [Bacteroidetes bacterium]|nr:YfhO family protein [Bacteroidota bacterium]